MKRTINSDGLLRVGSTCNYCGDKQKSPTVFSGLFRMPENVIKDNQDCEYYEADYFEIVICQDCFEKFDNDYNEIVKSNFNSWRY